MFYPLLFLVSADISQAQLPMKAKCIYFLLPSYHLLDPTLQILIVLLFSYIHFQLISLLTSCQISPLIWEQYHLKKPGRYFGSDCGRLLFTCNSSDQMKQQRCKNILDFLFIYQKLFPTRYCLLLLYYIPCPFILPVRMGKNSLINSKMQLHHFVSGIVNGIVFARNWSQGMDLKSQVSDLRTIFLP